MHVTGGYHMSRARHAVLACMSMVQQQKGISGMSRVQREMSGSLWLNNGGDHWPLTTPHLQVPVGPTQPSSALPQEAKWQVHVSCGASKSSTDASVGLYQVCTSRDQEYQARSHCTVPIHQLTNSCDHRPTFRLWQIICRHP